MKKLLERNKFDTDNEKEDNPKCTCSKKCNIDINIYQLIIKNIKDLRGVQNIDSDDDNEKEQSKLFMGFKWTKTCQFIF